MTDFFRFLLRGMAWGLFWVYGFSVIVGQKPVFNYLNEFLVKNPIVETFDRKLAEVLQTVRTKTVATRDEAMERFKSL